MLFPWPGETDSLSAICSTSWVPTRAPSTKDGRPPTWRLTLSHAIAVPIACLAWSCPLWLRGVSTYATASCVGPIPTSSRIYAQDHRDGHRCVDRQPIGSAIPTSSSCTTKTSVVSRRLGASTAPCGGVGRHLARPASVRTARVPTVARRRGTPIGRSNVPRPPRDTGGDRCWSARGNPSLRLRTRGLSAR